MQTEENLDGIELIRRKLEIIVGARLRKKESILSAIKTQDRLSKKSGHWNGTEEIIRWRQKK